MAQRVSLVPIVKNELDSVLASLAAPPNARHALAQELARASSLHRRRVAASERVVAASKSGNENWEYACNCTPYLIAARDAEGIVAAMATVTRLETDDAIESFFVDQAQSLDAVTGTLDGITFVAPREREVVGYIEDRLHKAAALRKTALVSGTDESYGDYAVSTWTWLGNIFARTQPTFWQGRNRWLGGAAFPDAFQVSTELMQFSPSEPPSLWGRVKSWFGDEPAPPPIDPALAAMIEASRKHTERQLALRSIQDLRALLVSAASLSSRFVVGAWPAAKFADALPPHGGGYMASGAVPKAQLDALVTVLRATQVSGELPYETAAEWIELVVAAAMWCRAAGADMLEADDALALGYRWPIL